MSDDIREWRDLPRGDYDSRADKLWSIYNKEAESFDRALMETWKDDMNSIIIFAGLFSAVLTAFLVDKSKTLRADPTNQTNALLNQTVFLLAQISQQLGPNGSQTIIFPLQPLEPFKLNPSNLRVNVFWFMSLGFSITAALGATLVQQWVRDYLQIFQRFSGSLERSRMRQFLFHGLDSNHMHLLVKFIPAFIHISLFLFFIGIAEHLFTINNTVAIAATAIIGFCALLYIVFSAFPVLYTKTPYHTPLSIAFWKMKQIIHPRKYSDKKTKAKHLPVSSDMAEGRLQLAMGHSNDRMRRDTEAICWVLTKITEDSEFEPFLASIGGSLATPWGRDVWRRILRESTGNADLICSTVTTMASNTAQALKFRIESLLRSCNVSTCSDQQIRFARACLCIDAVASLTIDSFEAGLELDINNVIMNGVLRYFGDEKKRRDKLVEEAKTSADSASVTLHRPPNVVDVSLEIKWKCLVLIGMKKTLRNCSWIADVVEKYGSCASSKECGVVKGESMNGRVREVDDELVKAWNAARQLYSELHKIRVEQFTEDRLNELVPHWKDYIDTMQASLYALDLRVEPSLDATADALGNCLNAIAGGALEYLGGIFSEWPSVMNPVTTQAMFKGINWGMEIPCSLWLIPHLVPPRLLICHLLVCADPRRQPNFDPSTSQIDFVGLGRLLNNPEMQRLFNSPRTDQEGRLTFDIQSPQPYTNQFWRVQDIGEHKGVGFMIEMFFATFRSLEEESVTSESRRLIEATLRTIADNGKSVYFKTARRRFLGALRQALYVPRSVVDIEQCADATKSLPGFIVWMLRDLFDESDEDWQPGEEGEEEEVKEANEEDK